MASVAYRVRRLARKRRAARERPKHAHRHPAVVRMLETSDYSPAAVEFFLANVRDPDLTVDFGLRHDAVVVDVGAFRGDWTEKARAGTFGRVIAFEPNPTVVTGLRRRFAGSPRVTVCDVGLGGADRSDRLGLVGIGSSVDPKAPAEGTATVAIRAAAGAFADLGLDRVDLLQVNIEGGEYELLPHLVESGWIDRIDVIVVQFHEWIPGAHRKRRQIRRTLTRTHDLVWDYPWVFEAWRRRT